MGRTTVTYHMNRLQTLDADREFCVTLNRSGDVDPDTVIRSLRYHHPVYTAAALAAQGRWARGERAAAHPLLRRLLGLRLPRGRRGVGAARVRALRQDARMSASALYEGWVRHRRHEPVAHEFSYRIFLSYLDLDELPQVLDRVALWSARRPAPAWFRRGRLHGRRPGAAAAGGARRGGGANRRAPRGPGRLLTSVRTFGHLFNPISVYYCFDRTGEQVEALAAEVTNTPWGERHVYACRGAATATSPSASTCRRSSAWTRTTGCAPASPASASRCTWRAGARSAPSSTRRSRSSAASSGPAPLFRYPLQSLRVVAGIYAQAVRLKLKGAPYHPHPAR